MELDRSLVSGSMALLVMKLLEDGDKYGYEMIEALRLRSDDTFHLKAGTLYPLLHTLEEKGLVTAYEGRQRWKTRRYYRLTEQGRSALREKEAAWNAYARAVHQVLRGGAAVAKPETILDYLDAAGHAISWRRARGPLLLELRHHLEDQCRALEDEGKTPAEAERLAVEEMGDPEETGAALDALHRPCPQRGPLVMIVLLALAGAFCGWCSPPGRNMKPPTLFPP